MYTYGWFMFEVWQKTAKFVNQLSFNKNKWIEKWTSNDHDFYRKFTVCINISTIILFLKLLKKVAEDSVTNITKWRLMQTAFLFTSEHYWASRVAQ